MERGTDGGNTLPPDQRRSRRTKGLLILAAILSVAAPLAMYAGRIPGLGEFDYRIYYRLLFFNDVSNSLAMLAAFAFALSIKTVRSWVEGLAGWLSSHPARGCLIAFIGLAAASYFFYQRFPLAMDEYAPLLQARIFASGDIALRYPLELLDLMVIPGFQGFFILVNHGTGEVVSAYWPGLALLMTPFAWLDAEWLLNPLLGTAGLWLIGDMAKQATGDERARGWAMLAAFACPQYTVNAISFYAMTGLLTLNLLFLWLLLRPGFHYALLAGLTGSVALVMHNPLPHALVAAPCILWLLVDRERRTKVVPLMLGYLPLTALICVGWPLLTSSMGLRPTGVVASDAGFFASWIDRLSAIFSLPDFDTLRIRSYAAWKTLIWSAPGLVLIALLGKPGSTIQRLLMAGLLLTFTFYFFFPLDQGHGWGYRYIHPAWGLIPIAAGIFAVTDRNIPGGRALIGAAVFAGLAATPVFMSTTKQTISVSIAQQPPIPDKGQFISFIDASRPADYGVDLIRNYPHDKNQVVRLVSQGHATDRSFVETIAPGATLEFLDKRGSTWRVSHLPSSPRPNESGDGQ